MHFRLREKTLVIPAIVSAILVAIDVALVNQRVGSLVVWISAVTIVSSVAVLVGLWAVLSRLVVRPLSSLTSLIRDVHERGSLDQDLPVHSSDEVGELSAAINALLHGIKDRDGQMQLQVDELRESYNRLEERVAERAAELAHVKASLCKEIDLRREADKQREAMHNELREASRKAGMADIATSVLHNVGNVLNSINVTATLLKQKLSKHHIGSLTKAVDLLKSHRADAQKYLDEDPQGSQLVPFLDKLSLTMAADQEKLIQDTDNLMSHVDHVKEIVSVQQSLARVSGAVETFDITTAIEDSLKINLAGLARHGVTVVKEYEPGLMVEADRHKVIQILVNLISNAKYAIHETERDGVLTVTVDRPDDDNLAISVTDTGVGIAPENRSKLFRHGFTTRKEGHGFGLHASAVAAQQLHGNITVQSDGPNQGATFTLNLPTTPPRSEQCPVAAAQNQHDS
jgi:C4-dicarboxylate-specific signal transduction histidine kinase